MAENGAVALVRSPTAGASTSSTSRTQQAAANFARMQQVAQRIVREVPGAVLARDSAGRETDIAIDHSEFEQLPPRAIAQRRAPHAETRA